MPQGFIHDELDIKLLVLYITSRAAGPLDFSTLTDLALCDSGVDYFLFSQAVTALVDSGHLLLEEGRYTITDKGRENINALESGLPSVVRGRCDRALAPVNAALRRVQEVTAQVLESDGRWYAELGLSDPSGPLLRLSLAAPSQLSAQQIVQNFQSEPESLFQRLLPLLLCEKEENPNA